MTTQIETAEHDIVVIKHARIRPMMNPTSSNPWRTGGFRPCSWTGSCSSTRQSYRSLPERRAFIQCGLVDRPQQDP